MQEKIGRKDFAHDIRDYKQSTQFKKAMKLEHEKDREYRKKSKKRGKEDERGEAFDERRVAANLLSGAEMATDQEERRWRDMFAMALVQAAQLVEQTELLRKAMEEHSGSEKTSQRIEEALHSIMTAQDEVESLSKTLKKAISAVGLKSRKSSGDSTETEGMI